MNVDDKWCVVVFEFEHENENLDPLGQVNEVFGPFTEDEAGVWVKDRSKEWPGLKFLITPLSSPNEVDPSVN